MNPPTEASTATPKQTAVILYETLERAMRQHQANRFDDAIAGYKQVLAINPNHADGRHLLGIAIL